MLDAVSGTIAYVHTRMHEFAHGVSPYSKEAFFNFTGYYVVTDELKLLADQGYLFQRMNETSNLTIHSVETGHIGMARDQWLKEVFAGSFSCDLHTVYEIGMCHSCRHTIILHRTLHRNVLASSCTAFRMQAYPFGLRVLFIS